MKSWPKMKKNKPKTRIKPFLFGEVLMNRNRELQIRNAACELLEETGSDFYNAISVNQLLWNISKYKISCMSTYLHGLDGFTVYDIEHDKYLILISPKSFNRKKFTVAHELGHIYLGHLKHYKNSTTINSKHLENEANLFAEELLMPTLGIILTGLNTADEITAHYAVSLESAKIKLSNLEKNALYKDYMEHIDLLGEIAVMGKMY